MYLLNTQATLLLSDHSTSSTVILNDIKTMQARDVVNDRATKCSVYSCATLQNLSVQLNGFKMVISLLQTATKSRTAKVVLVRIFIETFFFYKANYEESPYTPQKRNKRIKGFVKELLDR